MLDANVLYPINGGDFIVTVGSPPLLARPVVRARRSSLARCSVLGALDRESEDFDGSSGVDSGEDGECSHEDSRTDVDPYVGVVGRQCGCLEVRGQPVSEWRKLERQEVGHGGRAVRAAIFGQQVVDAVEELLSEADEPFRHSYGVGR